MAEEKIDYTKISASSLVKKRFRNERKKGNLTFQEFVTSVCKENSQYNSIKGFDRLKKTWFGQVADLYLLEQIQKLNSNVQV